MIIKRILLFIWCSVMLTTYAQVPNDIGVQSIQPLFLCAGDTDSVHVQVRNYGINPIDSFMVFWNIDAIQDSTWVYQPLDTIGGTGSNTVQLAVTTVTIQLSDIQISIWTKLPNGIMDNDLTNDTAYYVVPNLPQVELSDKHLCPGDSVIYAPGITQASYLWSDGSTNTLLVVNSPMVVSVTVTDFFGCISSDTAIVTQNTNVNLADSTHYCENDSVILDAGLHDSYLWSNGDTLESITVADTGYYVVTVTDKQCLSSDSIWVKSILDPVAIFHDSANYYTVVFTNLSLNADSYYWAFGDGTNSTNKNETHFYPWTGADSNCYNPILIASNICGSDTFGQVAHIRDSGWSFTWKSNIKSTVNNWQVDFSYSRSGQVFKWYFGDGATSSLAHPTHIYNPTGIYECYWVKVRAQTYCGDDYVRKRIAVGNYPTSNPCQIVTDVPKVELNPQEISVYPYPAHDILQINFTPNSYQNVVALELYDILGKQVLKKELFIGENQITISQLPVGVYTYRIGNIRGLVVVE